MLSKNKSIISEMLSKPAWSIYLKNHVQIKRLIHNTPIRTYADFHVSFHSKLCMECHQHMYSFGDMRYPLSTVSRPQYGEVCTGCARMFGPYKSLPDVIRLIKINLINPNSLSFYEDLPASAKSAIQSSLKNTRRHMQRRLVKNHRSDTEQAPSIEELAHLVLSSNRCALSGIYGSWSSLNVRLNLDHIVSISKGGEFGIMNIQPTMNFVNAAKGNESNEEALRWLKKLKETITG